MSSSQNSALGNELALGRMAKALIAQGVREARDAVPSAEEFKLPPSASTPEAREIVAFYAQQQGRAMGLELQRRGMLNELWAPEMLSYNPAAVRLSRSGKKAPNSYSQGIDGAGALISAHPGGSLGQPLLSMRVSMNVQGDFEPELSVRSPWQSFKALCLKSAVSLHAGAALRALASHAVCRLWERELLRQCGLDPQRPIKEGLSWAGGAIHAALESAQIQKSLTERPSGPPLSSGSSEPREARARRL